MSAATNEVDITRPSRHGPAIIARFVLLEPPAAERRTWVRCVQPTGNQHHRLVFDHAGDTHAQDLEALAVEFGFAYTDPKGRSSVLASDLTADLEALPAVVPLAKGVDVSAETLSFILDVLIGERRHQIELSDINTVVSQQGQRIAGLSRMSEEPRRLAEAALRSEILTRCTSIGVVGAQQTDGSR